MNIVDRAAAFAERAHKTQRRKYTNEPYFVHLAEVAKLCAEHGLDKRAIAAAYLHDTVEDQSITIEEIEKEFGSYIAGLVFALTDPPKRDGMNRKDRKEQDLVRLSKASADAQSIKCADLISNTSSIVKHDPDFARTYLPEKRKTLSVLEKADQHLWAKAWASLLRAEFEIANRKD